MFFTPTGTLRFSPSDLVGFLQGAFAAWMERLHAERCRPGFTARELPHWAPDEADPTDELVRRKGNEHEARYLAQLKAEGRQVVEIPKDESLERTRAAMAAGAEIIYQGHLLSGDLAGYPDFLVRVPGPSRLGDYHYEPWDTKLARSSRPYFLVQLCAYADLLEEAQGRRPAECAVVLGTGEIERFRVDEFFYYYRHLKQVFLDFQARFDPSLQPDPGLERKYARWTAAAERILEKSDHLSRVAGITRGQIRRLEEAGVTTLTGLGALDDRPIKGIQPLVRDRLRAQARQQLATVRPSDRLTVRPTYELLPPRPNEPRRGFALFPPPAALDVWFDMEGFPFTEPRLEYLFGAVTFENDSSEFHDWWAHDPAEEKRAFEGFIDWVFARWIQDPAMHIYHYAAYERSALKQLMGRHATREAEVDALLRGEVMVDLYTITREAVVIGTPSYSLKDTERLVAPPRASEVATAGDSTVAYQNWIDLAEPRDWRSSPVLKDIRDYNNEDCENTRLLHGWLRERQRESGIEWLPEPAGVVGPAEAGKPPTDAQRLAAGLLEDVSQGRPDDPERRRVTELLAYMLEFHRREDKPTWWRYFDLLEATDEEREDDPCCLTHLVRTDTPPRSIKRSWGYEYRFDPDKDTKIGAGSHCVCGHDRRMETDVVRMDPGQGVLEIKLGPSAGEPPAALTLILHEYVNPKVIAASVHRFVQGWVVKACPGRAVEDLLFRRPPRIAGHLSGPLPQDLADLVARMDDTALCIQGPPGSGKTYTAASIIAGLLAAGKRVGVAANSHKVILNLLQAVVQGRRRVPFQARIVKVDKEQDPDELAPLGIDVVPDANGLAPALAGKGPLLVGATAWTFSKEEFAGRFDYLVVDEAGQVSLANVVGMGQAARNLILVGDQMQLPQPTQGTHPGESGLSALDYLLAGRATIPPEFGVFLPESRRMHPAVCRFVSDAVYEGRLGSTPETERQRVHPVGPLVPREAGILVIPAPHDGDTQASEAEAEIIAGIVRELAGRRVTAQDGSVRALDPERDLLFVAPFNAQVRLLAERLGAGFRIGSVDRFQGQEAAVSIVSMCSSTLEDAPRGAGFLLNRNRLNVAISRAQALAIVVASPGLLAAQCDSIEEMRLVNFFCRLEQYAR